MAEHDSHQVLVGGEDSEQRRGADIAACALAVVVVLAQLALIPRLDFNWDEFLFLSHVYEASRGGLAGGWQTAYVHLFAWLPAVPAYEIGELVVGRLASYGAEILALCCLYAIARRFAAPRHAAFAVVAVLSCSYVLRHGVSFRADPYAVALFMLAIWLVLRCERIGCWAAIASGALLALTLLVTLKSVFYVAAIGGVLVLRWAQGDRARRFREAAWLAGTCTVVLAVMGFVHRATLAADSPSRLPAGDAGEIAGTVFGTGAFFPEQAVLEFTLSHSPLLWVTILGGLLTVLVRSLRRGGWRSREALLLPLALPLATVAFYRNSFPYYYVFILLPAAPLAGLLLRDLEKWMRARSRFVALWVVALIWIGTLVTLAAHYVRFLPNRTRAERQIVRVVHTLFPEPVPYVDRCSMISSFPKVGFFMSTWGVSKYWSLGRPIMEERLAKQEPVFLIVNSPGLAIGLPERIARRMPYALRPEDRRALRRYFIPHWGRLWVAGKTLRLVGGTAEQFRIVAGGPYTLEATGAVQIDGKEVAAGEVIFLAPGPHTIVGQGGRHLVRLRWGRHLPRPLFEPVRAPLFVPL